jgi:hypothetical protein
MYWRFFRRIRLLPNLWINLGKSGASVSVGMRGLRTTFGRRNKRLTMGLPGTGLSVAHAGRRAQSAKSKGTDGKRMLERALRERSLGD